MKRGILALVLVICLSGSVLAGGWPFDAGATHDNVVTFASDSLGKAEVTNGVADTSTTIYIGMLDQMTMIVTSLFAEGGSTKTKIYAQGSIDQSRWYTIDSITTTSAKTGSDSVKIDYKDFSSTLKTVPYVRFITTELMAANDSGHVMWDMFGKE